MTSALERAVLLLDSPALRPFRALGGGYRVRAVPGWEALDTVLATAPPSTVALVDPYVGRARGEPPAPRLRELLWRRPSATVVAALPLRAERVAHAAALLEWGVSELVDLELESTAEALLPRLHGAHARPLKRRVEQVLSQYASTYAGTLVRAACEVAVDGGGAPELAQRFGVEPRTVAGWCRREALPAPRRLQAWIRVLLAAALLEEPERSVLNAARGAGYATDHALRRTMRELAGSDPASLPRDRLFAAAAERFNAELRDLRELARERRRAGRAAREYD